MSATTTQVLRNCQVAPATFGGRLTTLYQSMAETLKLWRRRYRERHAFTVLDERDLRDLRLSRWQIERELAKPFWKG